MVVRRVLDYVISRTGAKLIPAAYQAFRKYDVRTTNQLFGKSGGKGFRHGRDLGLIASEFIGDEDIDLGSPPDEQPSRFNKARNRHQRRDQRRRCVCQRRDQQRRQPRKGFY